MQQHFQDIEAVEILYDEKPNIIALRPVKNKDSISAYTVSKDGNGGQIAANSFLDHIDFQTDVSVHYPVDQGEQTGTVYIPLDPEQTDLEGYIEEAEQELDDENSAESDDFYTGRGDKKIQVTMPESGKVIQPQNAPDQETKTETLREVFHYHEDQLYILSAMIWNFYYHSESEIAEEDQEELDNMLDMAAHTAISIEHYEKPEPYEDWMSKAHEELKKLYDS